MKLNDSDLSIERIRGQGPGGQHRNKTASCVRITHIPTGIQVQIDGRNQHQNLRKAKKELARRIEAAGREKAAATKKADRDRRVKETRVVRTYNQHRNQVKGSKITRSFDDVVRRGNIQDFLDEGLWDNV